MEAAGAATLRRIGRELVEITSNPSPDWAAESVEDNLLEWHFTLRGPEGTDFENGLYHGRIVLPMNYPFAPPSISLLTPSGRFEVNKKICLSISNFHPELWQPAWGVRTIIEALRSFFPTPAEGAIGSLEWPSEIRRKLAIESHQWTCPVCAKSNSAILPTTVEQGDKAPLEQISQDNGIPETVVLPHQSDVLPEQVVSPRNDVPRKLIDPRVATEEGSPKVNPAAQIIPPAPFQILNVTIGVVCALILALIVDIFV